MQTETRKLGSTKNWHLCPNCGVRETVSDELEEARQQEILIEKQKERDARGYYNEEGYNTH